MGDYPSAGELIAPEDATEINYFLLYHLLGYYFDYIKHAQEVAVVAANQGIPAPVRRQQRIDKRISLAQTYVTEYQAWSANFKVDLLQLTNLVVKLGTIMGWPLEDRFELHRHYRLFVDDQVRFALLKQALETSGLDPPSILPLITSALEIWPLRTELVDLLLNSINLQSLLGLLCEKSNLRLFRIWLQRFAATQPNYYQVVEVLSIMRGCYRAQEWAELVIEAFPIASLTNCREAPDDARQWTNLWFSMPSIRYYLIQRPLVTWTLNRSGRFYCSVLDDTITAEQATVVLEALLEQPLEADSLPLGGLGELISTLTATCWDKCRPLVERAIQQALMLIHETDQDLDEHCLSWPHDYFLQVAERLPPGIEHHAFSYIGLNYAEAAPPSSPHAVVNVLWLLDHGQLRQESIEAIVVRFMEHNLTCDGVRMICSHPILRAKLFDRMIAALFHRVEMLEVIWSYRQQIEPHVMKWFGELVESTEDPELIAVMSSSD